MVGIGKPLLKLILLKNYPILKQLQLEEALLRADNYNWCILNQGSPPAVVMGISGRPAELIKEDCPFPIIRRFSGGGTVIVDENTYFASFICNTDATRTHCCPQDVLNWSSGFYRDLIPKFSLQENDYVIGNRKFGGNAQYFRKERWLHHTSLLWDYDSDRMNYLLMPPRMPQYRAQRSHSDFLCRLCEHFTNQEEMHKRFIKVISYRFEIEKIGVRRVMGILQRPHRKATELISRLSLNPSLQSLDPERMIVQPSHEVQPLSSGV